jgi:hypothetical protein
MAVYAVEMSAVRSSVKKRDLILVAQQVKPAVGFNRHAFDVCAGTQNGPHKVGDGGVLVSDVHPTEASAGSRPTGVASGI